MQIDKNARDSAACIHVRLQTNQHEGQKMPATLRLTNEEQENLRKKAIEINKILINKGRQPIRDSELAHKILELSTTYVKVGTSGDIVLDVD